MKYPTVVGLVALLSAVSPVDAQTPHLVTLPPRQPLKIITDAEIDRNIDADITGADRTVIANVMKTLKAENRENAVYFSSNGRIYANHRSLLAKAHRWNSVGDNLFVDENGHRFAGPPQLPRPTDFTPGDPTAFAPTQVASLGYSSLGLGGPIAQVTPSGGGTSGPYRRVYSKPNYSYFNGYVTIPCTASNIQAGGVEAGYVYSGGWSASGNSVDAGVQYSSFYDNYALFVKEQGQSQVDSAGQRFHCGQDLYLQFYPGSAGQVTTAASGYDVNNLWQSISATTSATSDWTPYGANVVLKRMTTIAQTSQSFNDGTYFAYDPVAGSPLVHWYNNRLGSYDQATNSWPDRVWDGSVTGNYQKWPDADPTRILVNFVSAAEETDGINLHQ